MVAQWFSKVLDYIQGKLPQLKASSPFSHTARFKSFLSYAWQIIQAGAARGHAITAGVWYAFPFQISPSTWTFLIPFTLTGFFGKLWHRNTNPVLRFIALISRNFLKMGETAPIFLTIGNGLLVLAGAGAIPGNAGYIAIFFSSLALSMVKYGLDKKFTKKVSNTPTLLPESTESTNKMGRLRQLVRFVQQVALPIVKKAGQGALLKSVFSIFIGNLYQEENWVSQSTQNIPAANNPWLYLFVILPAAIKASVLIAGKAVSAAIKKKSVENVSIGLEAFGEGAEAFALTTLLTSKIISSFRADDLATNEEYFASMGVGAAFGALGVAHSLMKSFRQREKLEMAERMNAASIEEGSPLQELAPAASATPTVDVEVEPELVATQPDAAPVRKSSLLARGWAVLTSCFRRKPKGEESGEGEAMLSQEQGGVSVSSEAVPLVPFQLQRVAAAQSNAGVSAEGDDDGLRLLDAVDVLPRRRPYSPTHFRRDSVSSNESVIDADTFCEPARLGS